MSSRELVTVALVVAAGLVCLVTAARSVRIVRPHERGVVTRLGRVAGDRDPGLTFVLPWLDQLVKVSVRVVVAPLTATNVHTHDNALVALRAVYSYRVVDPVKALFNVENHREAVPEVALASLRSVIGRIDLEHLLSDRDDVNARLTDAIDAITEASWGVRVEHVELDEITVSELPRAAVVRHAGRERRGEDTDPRDLTAVVAPPNRSAVLAVPRSRQRAANRSPMDC